MIPPTEHLIVLVHDVFERDLVHVFVNHFRYNVSEGVWVVHSDIVRTRILQEDIHGSMSCTPFRCFFDTLDEVASRH